VIPSSATRPPFRRAAAAALAAAAGAAVLVSALPAAAEEVAVDTTGTVQQVVVERTDGRDGRLTLLVDGQGTSHPVDGLDTLPTGTKVRASLGRGVSAAGERAVRSFTVVAAARRPAAPRTAAAAAAAAPSYAAGPVVVVPITWAGGPALNRTGAQIAAVVNGDVHSYWQDASDRAIGFTASKVLAPVTLSASFCTSGGGVSSQALKEIYAAAGVTQGAENGTHVLAYSTQVSGCGWAGMATVSNNNPGAGGWVVVNGVARLDVIGHELGHNIGLGHSNLRWCAAANGTRAADAAADCEIRGYEDPYDIMGVAWNTSGNLNAAQRDQLGLLTPGGSVRTVSAGQVTLAPLGSASGLRGVRVADGTARYFLEYRPNAGRDSWLDGSKETSWYAEPGSGVVVHRQDTGRAGAGTELIDTVPVGDKLGRAALRAGEAWSSPAGKVTVTVVSVSATGAVVQVNGQPLSAFSLTGAPSAPSAPQDAVLRSGAVTLTWSASASTGAGLARYEVLSDGAVLATTAADTTTATVTVPTGRHTVAVRAVDTQGAARTSSNSVRYLIDPKAPAVSAVTSVFRAGTASSTLPVTISWNASDDASGVCRQVHAGAAGSPTLSGSARSVADTARPGSNEWSLTATDCAGNDTTATGSATAGAVQDAAMRYAGAWSTGRSAAAYGGTLRSTKVAGRKATASVTARSVALVATRAPSQGSVRVHVDGKLVATVSLYAKRGAARQVVWTYAWPKAGRHTVTFTNAGVKTRPAVNVDALLTLS
jgi:hypothetical protein